MNNDSKHLLKTSYRINSRIKSIIDKTNRDVRSKTGLELSMGRVARAFWITLAKDEALRKKCIKCVCKLILEEEFLNNVRRNRGKY